LTNMCLLSITKIFRQILSINKELKFLDYVQRIKAKKKIICKISELTDIS